MYKVIGSGILAVALIALVIYGIFSMKRAWNYSMGYETKVQETVCEMVKPEYLIDPSKC